MKFKKFVTEIEAENANDIVNSLSVIKKELSQFTPEELEDFGYWLHDELFDEEEEFVDLDYDGIIELITELSSDDLEYVVYMIDSDYEEGSEEMDHYTNTDSMEDDIEESAKFKAKNRNKIKTKRFSVSKAQFRAGKASRKKEARKNKIKNKKKYRKNKVKIKKYSKSYNDAVKSGKHNKKIRR